MPRLILAAPLLLAACAAPVAVPPASPDPEPQTFMPGYGGNGALLTSEMRALSSQGNFRSEKGGAFVPAATGTPAPMAVVSPAAAPIDWGPDDFDREQAAPPPPPAPPEKPEKPSKPDKPHDRDHGKKGDRDHADRDRHHGKDRDGHDRGGKDRDGHDREAADGGGDHPGDDHADDGKRAEAH